MGGALSQFLADLKRRHIYRVAAVYAVVAWILIQLIGELSDMLRLPEWAGSFVLVLLLVCFPLVLIFAWVHDLPAAAADGAPVQTTKLDWVLAGGLVMVIAGLVYQVSTAVPGAEAAQPTSAPADGISIAVLPLENLSGDGQQEYLSDGMTDEIATALAKVPSLRLVGRSSAFQFKGKRNDLRAIGQTLNATHLIDGSLLLVGNRVRVNAQLVRADDRAVVWTDNYEREVTDVFALQEEIAQAIAGALRAPLGLAAGERLVSSRTTDAGTYEEFVRGRTLLRNRQVDEAIVALEAAVGRDPAFAPAWAMLAQARRTLLEYSPLRRPDVPLLDAREFVQATLDKAEQAARRAIELDPRHDGGYAALAYIETTRGHWMEAEELFAEAFAIDPGNPEALYRYAQTMSFMGRIGESLRSYQQLLTIEPLVPIYRIGTANALLVNGRSQAGIALLEAISDDTPARYYRNQYLANAYATVGRHAEAADALVALRNESQANPALVDYAAGLMRANTRLGSSADLPALGDLTFVYGHLGVQDRVLDLYERSLRIGYATQLGNTWSPLWAEARRTQRFKQLLRDYGLVDYWRERGWPDLCVPLGETDFACD